MLDHHHQDIPARAEAETSPVLTRAAFLREYFRGTKGGIYLSAIRNPKSTLASGQVDKLVTRSSSAIDKFVADYDKPAHSCAVYYCTATLLDGHTNREAADCWQFPSLFADCDDHNHNFDHTRVIELLEAIECPPSMIVNSGHGLQPHWLLAEPSEDAERIVAARKKLQALTASDAVHDAPRFMRLPGSHNSKFGDWLPVEVVTHYPERRYTLDVLEEWLETADVVIPHKVKAKGNGAGNDRPFVLPPATNPSTTHKRGAAWACKALEASAGELANAGEGSRHNTLRDKSVRMATMIVRGWIDVHEVRRSLYAAAEACGQIKDYGVAHFDETFAAGIKYGMAMAHPDLPEDGPPRGDHTHQDEPQPPHGPEDYEPRPETHPPREPIRWIDMSTWDNEPRPEREWAIMNRVPLNQAGLFSGEGGAGKSIIEMMKDVAHVTGRDWLGSMPEPGPAIYLGAEDDEKEIHIRFYDIATHYGMTFKQLIDGGLHVLCKLGQDATLCAGGKSGKVEVTDLYRQIYQAAGDIKPKNISIDTLSRAFAGNEIDRVQVYAFAMHMQALAMVANGSVTVLSHPSLQGIASGSGISGSTAWHGAFRFRQYLKGIKITDAEQPDSDLRELEFKKNQYGPTGETIVLRYQRGLFLPEVGISNLDKLAHGAKVDQVFLQGLRQIIQQGRDAMVGMTSAEFGPTLIAELPDVKKERIRKKDLINAMNRLLADNKIHVGKTSGPPSKAKKCLHLGAAARTG